MARSGSKPHNGLRQEQGYKPAGSVPNAKPGHSTQATTATGAAPQPAFEFYSGPPDAAGHTWHAFTLDTPEEEAAAAFLRRYDRNPEFVFESRGNLLCGPIPEVTTL